MTAAPATLHQRVVVKLVGRLFAYCEVYCGEVLTAPFDVYFSETNVVEPDLLYVRPENRDRLEKRFFRSAPDRTYSSRLLMSSSRLVEGDKTSTTRYWFVDLDAERVEGYRLEQDRYGHPLLFTRGEAAGDASRLRDWH